MQAEGTAVDFQKVVESLSRQVAQQAQTIAVLEAIKETQSDEIVLLRQRVDELAALAIKADPGTKQKPPTKKGK